MNDALGNKFPWSFSVFSAHSHWLAEFQKRVKQIYVYFSLSQVAQNISLFVTLPHLLDSLICTRNSMPIVLLHLSE